MKFAHTKFGLRHNPAGAHVSLQLGKKTLLGEVVSFRREEVTGAIRLRVRHFNGDPWPIEPTSWAVDVLERRP